MATTVRVQLDMDSESVDKMDAVMKQTKTATRKEFINTALTVFYWVIRERSKGYSIASIDEQNKMYRELSLPALEEVAVNGHKPKK